VRNEIISTDEGLFFYFQFNELRSLIGSSFLKAYRQERDALEGTFLESANDVAPEGRSDLTQRAFAQAREATTRWVGQVRDLPIQRLAKGTYRRYWRRQNRRAGIEVSC